MTERLYTQAEVDALVARARDYVRGKCRYCGGLPNGHRMHCRLYEGPLTHTWTHTHWNETWGGVDYYCSCGATVRVGGAFREEDDLNEVPVCSKAGEESR